MASKTHWFEGNIDAIGALLKDKCTASQIASRFRVSRSAVIGIVRRNPKLNEIGFYRKPAPVNIEKARKRYGPRRSPQRAVTTQVREPKDYFGAPQVAGMPLMMLGLRHCRWCINDPEPGTDGHLFCGETTNSPAKPYCKFHTELSVGAGTFAERAADKQFLEAA